MTKQRSHNEWFRTVSLKNRKTCPTCKAKLNGEQIWSWGEYIYGKWRTVTHFCHACSQEKVVQPLSNHAKDCGCNIVLRNAPDWLSLTCPERRDQTVTM